MAQRQLGYALDVRIAVVTRFKRCKTGRCNLEGRFQFAFFQLERGEFRICRIQDEGQLIYEFASLAKPGFEHGGAGFRSFQPLIEVNDARGIAAVIGHNFGFGRFDGVYFLFRYALTHRALRAQHCAFTGDLF